MNRVICPQLYCIRDTAYTVFSVTVYH